jgi:hypothetical protein
MVNSGIIIIIIIISISSIIIIIIIIIQEFDRRRKNLPLLNPLSAELNPICHLLALLEAHPILHVSRIKVNTGRYHDPDRKLLSDCANSRIVTARDLHVSTQAAIFFFWGGVH